jgi:iron-sulfur cluster repair protein YtfE (RIC family)
MMPSSKTNKTGKTNRAARTSKSDVIALLKEDHAKVRGLLEKLSETTTRGQKTRQELLYQIEIELETHARVEEELVYPVFLEIVGKEDRKLFFEAREEHALVRKVLKEIGETPLESEEFGARAKVLKDLVEHHAEEEEKEMFPKMKAEIERERLVEMADEVEIRKEALAPELEERFQHAAS